jgi:Putative auto-transporter adhesin, head GIN domain
MAVGLMFITPLTVSAGDRVVIKNLVAKVIIVPQARTDTDVSVKMGRNLTPNIKVERSHGNVTIDGNQKGRSSCRSSQRLFSFGNGLQSAGSISLSSQGPLAFDDLPTVIIYTSKTIDLISYSAVYGMVGDNQGLSLNMHGCGDWKIGTVEGPLTLISSGSGDITVKSARKANIFNSGPGDIVIGPLQSLMASQSGSGDTQIGAILEGMSIAVAGSGDMVISSIKGPVEISVAGSGDVNILKGQASRFKVAIAGSGDVNFYGKASLADVAIIGSGDVTISKLEGPIVKKILGSGEVITRP